MEAPLLTEKIRAVRPAQYTTLDYCITTTTADYSWYARVTPVTPVTYI